MDSYDPESGQVFKETIVKVGKNEKMPDYHFRRPADRQVHKRILACRQRSTKTLQQLSMQKIISHANSLLPETLESLPEPIVIKIWSAIRREGYESFHVWKAFINAGFRERTFRHHLSASRGRRSVTNFFDSLVSHDFAWVVNLTVGDMDMSVSDLREVSRVRNLRTLQVHYERRCQSNILDDRIVQVWSQRAASGQSFSRLETLAITNAPGFTVSAFEHLAAFPVLSSVFLFQTGVKSSERDGQAAERSGWRRDLTHLDSTLQDPIEDLKRKYEDRSRIHVHLSAAIHTQGFVDRRLPHDSGPSSGACVLEARLGRINATSNVTLPDRILCFERDPGVAVSKVVEDIVDSAPTRKKQKVNDSKAADFAAMLEGG